MKLKFLSVAYQEVSQIQIFPISPTCSQGMMQVYLCAMGECVITLKIPRNMTASTV